MTTLRAQALERFDRTVASAHLCRFIETLPAKLRNAVRSHLKAGAGGGRAAANILGKHYVKQVDVVMSPWATGPELMISTKRMDSSFGKNAANRVEESYGDAKNRRSRHPQAALGFFYCLGASALDDEPDTARWLIDLLGKLRREADAYDAVGLVILEIAAARSDPTVEIDPAGPLEPGAADAMDSEAADQPSDDPGDSQQPRATVSAVQFRASWIRAHSSPPCATLYSIARL